MPYLQACIKEALRLHPAVGMPLERVVPEGGMSVAGNWFQPGTIVGANAWVLHRNKDVFGQDAEFWNPDRWLKAETQQLRAMERASFAVRMPHTYSLRDAFRYFSLTTPCPSVRVWLPYMPREEHLPLRDIKAGAAAAEDIQGITWVHWDNKTTIADFRQITLETPGKEWKTENFWFVKPESLNVKFRER
jgi:hypothetical protein